MEDISKSIRGGKRIGSGRKPWSNYKEPTVPIRIPLSQESTVRDFLEAFKKKKKQSQSISNVITIERFSLEPTMLELPLYSSKVAAGFPSPADDHVEKRLDLNAYLIKEADATFFVRIKGDSMIEAGIFDNDVAVVDKSILASVGDIVLASVNGEFTVKTLARAKNGNPRLLPANPNYSPIEINEGTTLEIWGVLTGSVRKFK